MRAYCLIRREPHYRADAFVVGLQRCGFKVETSYTGWPVKPGDVLVIWNRYGATEQLADKFEAAGGTVLVAENGYLGPGGVSPHQMQPRTIYALARHAHNGRGQWHVGGPERLAALGVTLEPWRTDGDYVLVCPNRVFGMRGGIMPAHWAETVKARLEAQRHMRPVRIRAHPGNGAAEVPLERDLARAATVVIWGSSVGVQALVRGIPVVCCAPWWICKEAGFALGPLDFERLGPWECNAATVYRARAMESLAWAQWDVDEIASGEPFRYLLSDTRQAEGAAHV